MYDLILGEAPAEPEWCYALAGTGGAEECSCRECECLRDAVDTAIALNDPDPMAEVA